MSTPQLDWSFSDAPDDRGAPEAELPAAPLPSKPPRRPLPRRLIVALAALATVAGLGALLFTRLDKYPSWLRLQSQLAAQVIYEDNRALAGDVAAVLAVQAAGQADWREQMAARARLELAAPLPAGDLLPAGTPPRLSRLDPLGGDLFDATITRDYVDSSGQTYAFDLVQRYRNISPGAWERLPLDEWLVNNTTLFHGQRLDAIVPTADLPWLGSALLHADDLIVRACADWGGCPAGLVLAASFGLTLEISDPTVNVRHGTNVDGRGVQSQRDASQLNAPTASGDEARIFFASNAPAPGRLLGYALPTPLLAGRPHDAAAQAALSRSISVQLLAAFAGAVSGAARTDYDYFLDALVARVEVRHLGASPAPWPVAPQDYVPLKLLWQVAGLPRPTGGWRTDLAARHEAFDFLNFALAGQPATVDGQLLRNLRGGDGQSLDGWLMTAFRPAAQQMSEAWTQQALAEFARHPVADWKQFDGLTMGCDDGVYQVQGGAARLVMWNLGTPELRAGLGSVSPDRRYADIEYYSTIGPAKGVTNSAPSTWTVIVVVDLETGDYHWVYEAPQVATVGWTASDDLIYAIRNTQNTQADSAEALQLRTYHASTGINETLIPDRVDPYAAGPNPWSADHSSLLLVLADEVPRGQFRKSLAVLQFGPHVALFRLPQVGDGPALSPDGRRVAYVKFAGPAGTTAGIGAGVNRLEVLDLATGNITSLAATDDLALPLGITNFFGPRWSEDGAQLAWHAYLINQGAYLLSAPAGGGPPRVWAGAGRRQMFGLNFSPDGRFLAAVASQNDQPLNQTWLFDQQATTVKSPITAWRLSNAWSPKGHRLVLSGPAGVSALDPATGDYEWLGAWQNCQLRW